MRKKHKEHPGSRPPGMQKCKLSKRKRGMNVPPEVKAARTKGIPMTGRITLKQYMLLVEKGYDGEALRRWTKYHAHQVIEKVIIKAGTVRKEHSATAPPNAVKSSPIDWEAVLGV